MRDFLGPLPFIDYHWDECNLTYKMPIFLPLGGQLSPAVLSIFWAEFVILLPSMICMSYFVWVIVSISLMHRNISVILMTVLMVFVASGGARMIILMIQLGLIDENPIILLIASLLRFEFYGFAIAGFPATAIERTFATYYLADYESSRRRRVLLVALPVLVVAPQPFVALCMFAGMSIAFACVAAGSAIGVSQVVLIALYEANLSESRAMKRNPIMYTLARKFQLEENLRVMWYLRGVGIILLSLCLLLILILIFPSFLAIDNYANFYCAIDFLLALASLVLPIFLSGVLYFKQQPAFLRKTSWLFGSNSSSKTLPNVRRLTRIQNPAEETSAYFRQFEKSWK